MKLVSLAPLAFAGQRVLLVIEVIEAQQVLTAIAVLLAKEDQLALLAAKVPLVSLAHEVVAVPLEQLVQQGTKVQLARLAHKVVAVLRVPLVQPATKVPLARLVWSVHKEHKEQQVIPA